MIDLNEQFDEHIATIEGIRPLVGEIEAIAGAMALALANGNKVLWMGNGGSAADCQHLAAELVGRYRRERQGLASIALTTDTSILTAVANDYGFDSIFARQIESLCHPGDVVVGLSTSGNSANVLKGIALAGERGAITIGFTGRDGGALRNAVDRCVCVPATSTARIQEAHILIGHLLCDWVEAAAVESANDASRNHR